MKNLATRVLKTAYLFVSAMVMGITTTAFCEEPVMPPPGARQPQFPLKTKRMIYSDAEIAQARERRLVRDMARMGANNQLGTQLLAVAEVLVRTQHRICLLDEDLLDLRVQMGFRFLDQDEMERFGRSHCHAG